LAVASGETLPWSQETLSQRGHAIEARVYAEDPARDHLPQAGHLLLYREPSLPGIRIDSGFAEGDRVSVHYDPLIAKVIATGSSRHAARRRLIDALQSFPILGIRTNVGFLLQLLEHPRFVSGEVDTSWLDREGANIQGPVTTGDAAVVAAIAAAARTSSSPAPGGPTDPWSTLRDVRV